MYTRECPFGTPDLMGQQRCPYHWAIRLNPEGELVNDCFDDPRLALRSACFPCYRFGKNMKRAGFGSCFLQGSFTLILFLISLSNLLAFTITRRYYFLYLAISFSLSVGMYFGYYRLQIKKKFNIRGGETSFDDFVYHLICLCCALCQGARTLEKNNVQDSIWHERGDTICVGSFSSDEGSLYRRMKKIIGIWFEGMQTITVCYNFFNQQEDGERGRPFGVL